MTKFKSLGKKIAKDTLDHFFGSRNPFAIYNTIKLRAQRKLYNKKFTTKEFLDFIISLNIKPGDTIFFQSSWTQFYNYNGRPNELVDALIDFVGPSGTLAMPANTEDQRNRPFHQARTPTNAGLICEVFRRRKGVVRSIHYNSSVCAFGRYADHLVGSHQNSYTSWDEHSPYMKLTEMNAKNLTVGLGPFFTYVTPIHCVDSILRTELPYYNLIFTDEFDYIWIDSNGKTDKTRVLHRGNGKINLSRYSKFVKDIDHRDERLSNLEGFSVSLKPLIARGLELGRNGIFLYDHPKPRKIDLVPSV